MSKVSTHLMFQNGKAKAAMEFYKSIFPTFVVRRLEEHGNDAGAAAGFVKFAQVDFAGHALIVIDSPVPHAFAFTPSVSLLVDFDTVAELDATFATLSDQGKVMMGLNDYGFSKRFGWLADKFGVSWQLNLGGLG